MSEKDLTQELDALRDRLVDLEDQLIARGVEIHHNFVLGKPITNAKWSNVAGEWSAKFCYRCECGRIHGATLIVPAKSPDGGFYDVPGECGKSTAVHVWKDGTNQLRAALTPKTDTAADRFNSYGPR